MLNILQVHALTLRPQSTDRSIHNTQGLTRVGVGALPQRPLKDPTPQRQRHIHIDRQRRQGRQPQEQSTQAEPRHQATHNLRHVPAPRSMQACLCAMAGSDTWGKEPGNCMLVQKQLELMALDQQSGEWALAMALLRTPNPAQTQITTKSPFAFAITCPSPPPTVSSIAQPYPSPMRRTPSDNTSLQR